MAKFPYRGKLLALNIFGLPSWLSGRESTCQCRRHGFDPWSRRSPGKGNGNPLQHLSLGNLMDRRASWAMSSEVAKSQTQLSD